MADYYNNQNQNPTGPPARAEQIPAIISLAHREFWLQCRTGEPYRLSGRILERADPRSEVHRRSPEETQKEARQDCPDCLFGLGWHDLCDCSFDGGRRNAGTADELSGSGSESDSQPEHLIISQTPTVSDGDDGTVVSTGLTTREIAAKALDSVVGINLYSSQQVERVGEASGIVLDTNGYIITNAHVVSDGYSPTVVFGDGTEVAATVIGYDTRTDLAVVKVDPTGLNLVPAEFGDSDTLQLGDDVVAIGNASGYYTAFQGRCLRIEPGCLDQYLDQLIQTDAASTRATRAARCSTSTVRLWGSTPPSWQALRSTRWALPSRSTTQNRLLTA